MKRRTFLMIPGVALISGCDQSRYKHRQQDLPGRNARNRTNPNNRKYPCGVRPDINNATTWEYTVITTARYPVRVNGRIKMTSKHLFLCGKPAADAWRAKNPLDLVFRSGP